MAKPVEEFVKNNPQYEKFATSCIANGVTPIFEWCSRKQRIVLDYKEDQLILTALRDMKTGEYAVFDSLNQYARYHSITVVRAFEPQTDMKAFLEYVHDLEDLEGFVVRFDDGHMLKLKCQWYLQIHRAKEAILQDRNIVEIILDEKLDDIKAHLPAEDRDRLSEFEHDFNIEVSFRCIEIESILKNIEADGIDRKTFALEIAPKFDNFLRSSVFTCWDDKSKVYNTVRNTIRNNLGRTVKYEAIRDAWFPGLAYND